MLFSTAAVRSRMQQNETEKTQTRRNFKTINPKNTNKSPIHENTNAKITCDFGDDRCRIASARIEKDIFVKTRLHTSPIVENILLQGERYFHRRCWCR